MKIKKNGKIFTLTEEDLSKILKGILNEESHIIVEGNKETDFKKVDKNKEPSAFRRKLISKEEGDVEMKSSYTTIRYGYNRVNEKEVIATHEGTQGYGPVSMDCNKKEINWIGDVTYYDKEGIDIVETKKEDINWLSPFCEIIKWKSKVKVKH